jgi:hypothetical protein
MSNNNICRYWLKGGCKKNNCKWFHPDQSQPINIHFTAPSTSGGSTFDDAQVPEVHFNFITHNHYYGSKPFNNANRFKFLQNNSPKQHNFKRIKSSPDRKNSPEEKEYPVIKIDGKWSDVNDDDPFL